MKHTRVEVFHVIESELDYQERTWAGTGSNAKPGDGTRTLDERVAYINGYAQKALAQISHAHATNAPV